MLCLIATVSATANNCGVHFYRTTHMHSMDYAVARCLSVHLSVTRQYSVNTAEHILNIFYCQVAPPLQFFRT